MTEELPPKPPESSDDTNANALPEAELDAVLSEAAALAGDLAAQIGEAPPVALEMATRIEAPSELASSTEQVELELAELERLVDVASTEVKEPPTRKKQAEAPKEAESSYDVPDFMSEFTEPAADPVEPTAPPEDSMAALDDLLAGKAPEPAVAKPAPPGPLGVVSSNKPPAVPEDPPADQPETREPGRLRRMVDRVFGAMVRRAGVLGDRLAPLACAVCHRGVGVLELIDRPLGRIGGGIRRVVGLAALATLGLSLLVFAYSFL